ncbi:hypothetical protein BTM25_49120 [Actinomadura rubteroloni]|uniref:Uncharacterized protein n=1 Tax=Actinomadura rubteroloni TaxID=1926885 RepID=A0A2P4UCD9_9ACTN|nr:hypothetical protein [Actinomadura rubteroloni]POM22708.1 hypothetical protein BTM25_49120 [Actinomadura rubteroloni]
MNDHEVNEECLRLLRDGLPDTRTGVPDVGLTFLPLCLDVDGDVAVVTVLTFDETGNVPGESFIDGWTFHRRNGEWMALGGGGGAAPAEPLARRSAAELGRHLRRYGSGRTVRNADRLLPWGAKYVNQVRLRVASEATQIRVGRRVIPVPQHGHVAVVWTARRAPLIEALDPAGTVLDALELERSQTPEHNSA